MRATGSIAKLFGAVLLLGVVVLIFAVPRSTKEEDDSTLSLEPNGARALFLLCEALGFPVAAWTGAPGELSGRGTLLVLTERPDEPTPGPRPPGADAGPRRALDLAHYRRFMEEGGTLLVTGDDALAFARDKLAIAGLDEIESRDRGRGEAEVAFDTGASVRLEDAEFAHLRGDLPDGALVLARSGELVLSVLIPVVRGRLVLLAMPFADFRNASLEGHASSALFFVRLLERLEPFERVLFDEYALGEWQPASPLALAFGARTIWISVHLLVLLALLLWRATWSGPFARDPEPLAALSALSRARGFGRLFARAGRWDVLARLLRHGLLERWSARAGLAPPPSDARGQSDPAALGANLRQLARGDEHVVARARAAFERAPASEAELVELERELAALERELFAPRTESRRARGARASANGS